MPAKSEKQRRFMAAVANNPKFAKKTGVPQSVGVEFMKKSKGYMGGGMMKRYAEGDMIDIGGVGGAPGDEITRGIPDDTPRPKRKPKPPKKPVKKVRRSGEGAAADMRARMADKEESGLLGGQMTDEQRLRKALGEEPSGYKKGGKVKAKKASKPKVRGAGKAMKGVRPAKMVAMKGA